jgi:hypothetical protein
MAERPDEQGLFRGQIGRDGLADIEAVDEERPVFVRPGWQRSWQQTGQSVERVPRPTMAPTAQRDAGLIFVLQVGAAGHRSSQSASVNFGKFTMLARLRQC